MATKQTPEQALQNLRVVVSEFTTTGKNHVLLLEALEVLTEAIAPKTLPVDKQPQCTD